MSTPNNCRYYLAGHCSKGSACQFLHNEELKNERVCCFWLQGRCKFGELCRKSHAEEDEAPKHASGSTHKFNVNAVEFRKPLVFLKTLLMCPIHAETGKCDQNPCEYLHGNKCARCNRWCLHPYCEEKQVAHVMECEHEVKEFFKKHLDEQCSICLLEFELGEEFGFLFNCHHVFQMHCAKEALALRPLCPLCRTPGQIVYPNFFYVPFGEEA